MRKMMAQINTENVCEYVKHCVHFDEWHTPKYTPQYTHMICGQKPRKFICHRGQIKRERSNERGTDRGNEINEILTLFFWF